MKLSDAQRLDWLCLIRSENIGPRTFRTLINRFGGAGRALEALPDLARQGGRTIRIADRSLCERELDALGRMGGALVCLGEAGYPVALQGVDMPPPVLSIITRNDVLTKPGVAIVGSRNASAAGLTFAERVAQDLGGAGMAVVSGLARGIDARAHRASLKTGTVAVVAGGLDKIYPSEHASLFAEIAEQGAVVSEMPLGWEPRGRDFPRRNRIVSGISLATIVIEAARRSGSLITARFAAEQNREVFAVPGSPLDPRAEGTNDLLRNGATLCTSAQDVMDALQPILRDGIPTPGNLFDSGAAGPAAEPLWDELDLFGESPPTTQAGHELDEDGSWPLAGSLRASGVAPAANAAQSPEDVASSIRQMLGPAPVNVDDLARLAGASMNLVRSVLLDLELEGKLDRHGGNLVSLTSAGDVQERSSGG
ncbi:MAG: DNA-processing protein DprA [Beijerinckiaceae bacterium]|nr:DNA-processing protein DprA [Beijerinckiaceae bacterium]